MGAPSTTALVPMIMSRGKFKEAWGWRDAIPATVSDNRERGPKWEVTNSNNKIMPNYADEQLLQHETSIY